MTRGYSVAVIGEGLAGRMAALAAARHTSSVALLSRSASSLRSATGLVGLLGYLPDRTGPVANPFDRLPQLPQGHPLSVCGDTAVREGFELFDTTVGERYAGGHTDRNGLLPTSLGTPIPAARYPRSMEPGLLSRTQETLLLGFGGLPGLNGEFAATQLAASELPYRIRGGNIDLLSEASAEQPRLRLARALDRDERWPMRRATARESLAERIQDIHGGEPRVGLPAVLGRKHTAEIRADLESAIGATIFEYPTPPPSIPGIRLADALDTAIADVGVRRIVAREVTVASGDGGRVEAVGVAGRNTPLSAREFVLATGGLIGGGIEEHGGGLVEAAFDLPVAGSAAELEHIEMDPFAQQPFAKAGLRTDESLRPKPIASAAGDEEVEPIYSNLRACGSVLAGYDFAYEHSGAGVAITTGMQAGREAGMEADA